MVDLCFCVVFLVHTRHPYVLYCLVGLMISFSLLFLNGFGGFCPYGMMLYVFGWFPKDGDFAQWPADVYFWRPQSRWWKSLMVWSPGKLVSGLWSSCPAHIYTFLLIFHDFFHEFKMIPSIYYIPIILVDLFSFTRFYPKNCHLPQLKRFQSTGDWLRRFQEEPRQTRHGGMPLEEERHLKQGRKGPKTWIFQHH